MRSRPWLSKGIIGPDVESIESFIVNKPALNRIDSQRRHRILIDAATELFLEVGYSGASLNQLVERAGGSKSTIYAYFRDKEGLFVAVIDDMLQEILIPLYSMTLGEQDLYTSLTQLADHTLAVMTSHKGTGLSRIVYAESVKLPAVGKAFYKHGPHRAIIELSQYLEKLSESGTIQCDNPTLASEFFWGMLLHKPMLQGLCSVERPMNPRARKKYVTQVIDNFIKQFTD